MLGLFASPSEALRRVSFTGLWEDTPGAAHLEALSLITHQNSLRAVLSQAQPQEREAIAVKCHQIMVSQPYCDL